MSSKRCRESAMNSETAWTRTRKEATLWATPWACLPPQRAWNRRRTGLRSTRRTSTGRPWTGLVACTTAATSTRPRTTWVIGLMSFLGTERPHHSNAAHALSGFDYEGRIHKTYLRIAFNSNLKVNDKPLLTQSSLSSNVLTNKKAYSI